MTNKVINGGQSAAKGKGRVYIGRGTAFGNKFIIGVHGTRDECIILYKEWFYSQPNIQSLAQTELRGKTLVCHCKPLACHGDVLAEYLAQFMPKQKDLFDD